MCPVDGFVRMGSDLGIGGQGLGVSEKGIGQRPTCYSKLHWVWFDDPLAAKPQAAEFLNPEPFPREPVIGHGV